MQGKIKLSQTTKEFKHKQFEAEVILWAVRWYCQFAISYRDLVALPGFVLLKGSRNRLISLEKFISRRIQKYFLKQMF